MEKENLLEVKDLYTSFNIPSGEVRSVNGISFSLKKGEVLGIVGESGSGKSVTAYSIMQILEKPGRVVSGSIKFRGQELLNTPNKQLQKIRGSKISIIFQDSMSSLNPVWSIGNQLMEVVKIHSETPLVKAKRDEIDEIKQKIKNKDGNIEELKKELKEAKKDFNNYAQNRALEMLRLVGINEPEKRLKQYPFEFSGGMLQRIMIAMALICEPDVIIADEPTTALDVTIQAQILELLLSLQKKMGMGIIIITHDLGVVAQICDRVNVMYAGRIVETGTVDDIFYNPKHEYTKGLINSIPKMDVKADKLEPIPGNPVDVFRLPSGCSFSPRCESCMKICLKKFPSFLEVDKHHQTACFKYLQELINEGKISDKEVNEYLDSCIEGNKAFKRISRLDVKKALYAYRDTRKENKEKIKDKNLSKDEIDTLNYHITLAKQEYHRARKDFKYARKDAKASRGEKLSIDKNDVNKKIGHHKVEIKSMANLMDEEQFNNYLNGLSISTTPVNKDISEEIVKKQKKEYLKEKMNFYKIFFKFNFSNTIDSLAKLDDLFDLYHNAKSDLKWFKYINKKMGKTKIKLRKIYDKYKQGGKE